LASAPLRHLPERWPIWSPDFLLWYCRLSLLIWICRLIKDYLEPLGYEVLAAYTGPESVEKATSEAWHAVILNVMLPALDGFAVLKQIRRQCDVPVLMLTARGEEADRIVGLEIGADDYLPNPEPATVRTSGGHCFEGLFPTNDAARIPSEG
jgi:CheY-like chemotaxis protein